MRDHIQDFVAYRTSLKDGQVFSSDRRGPRPVTDAAWVALYVDPRTGLIRRTGAYNAWPGRRGRSPAETQTLAKRLRVLAPDRQLHLLGDGNWWEVTLAAEPRPEILSAPPVDVIDCTGLSALPRAVRYDRRGVYAIAKRPLSRKEIRARGLRP